MSVRFFLFLLLPLILLLDLASSFGSSLPVIRFSEIKSGILSSVEAKLDHGANPDRIDRDGHTLLWQAAFFGRYRMVRLLLSHGALPDQPDASGKTPLYWAASNGSVRIVRVLLEHGADPNRLDGEGTAIDWAIANGHRRVVYILEHWTSIRRGYLLRQLPRFLNLISERDRNRLGEGHFLKGPLSYAVPGGLYSAPWKSRGSFVHRATEFDRRSLFSRFGGPEIYPSWRRNAILEIANHLKGPFIGDRKSAIK